MCDLLNLSTSDVLKLSMVDVLKFSMVDVPMCITSATNKAKLSVCQLTTNKSRDFAGCKVSLPWWCCCWLVVGLQGLCTTNLAPMTSSNSSFIMNNLNNNNNLNTTNNPFATASLPPSSFTGVNPFSSPSPPNPFQAQQAPKPSMNQLRTTGIGGIGLPGVPPPAAPPPGPWGPTPALPAEENPFIEFFIKVIHGETKIDLGAFASPCHCNPKRYDGAMVLVMSPLYWLCLVQGFPV
ncbi:hypothetical protein GWK47_001057 [Chionoecetes opilio]|uniref:Uncharacterized protein n=1 Tax=Chionoecetes opilio TaxID=41210 RepID=A0A8J4Y406_CHIOP|nr:hypothetical protein GWK47_001057 [Chionoecetes opilio]